MIKKINILVYVLLSCVLLGCSRQENQSDINEISKAEMNQKMKVVLKMSTYEDIHDLFVIYYKQVYLLEGKYSITKEEAIESLLSENIDENILLYIDEYEQIGGEFKKQLEDLDIQDEDLEDVRYYLIKHVDYAMNSCEEMKLGIEEGGTSAFTKAEIHNENAENYLNKALKILEEKINVNLGDYSWYV